MWPGAQCSAAPTEKDVEAVTSDAYCEAHNWTRIDYKINEASDTIKEWIDAADEAGMAAYG